jgi:hypothetical protein
MEGGPVHGILGRDAELAEVKSFIGSGSGGPSALLLEGTAGIGKTTLWRAGVSFARARGHRVLSCRAAEAEARLSYAALGDLFDFELPDLPAPQRRALDAALLRAEAEGAPPDQRAVSVASLGVLRALAASAPVIVAIDDVQWLDAPSARVLAFVGSSSGGRATDPGGAARRFRRRPARPGSHRAGAEPAPGGHRPAARGGDDPPAARSHRGDLPRPVLLRLHRISGGTRCSPLRSPGRCPGRGPAGAWRTPARPRGPASAAGHPARRATVERRCWAPRRRRCGPSDRGSGGCGGRIEPGIDRHPEGRGGGHPAAGRRPDRVHPPAPGVDLPLVQGRCEQALQEAGEDAGTRTALLEHLAWVGIYRGDLGFAAKHARASQQWARRTTHPAIRAESLSTFAMVEFLSGRVEPVRRPACREASNHPA